MSKPTSNEDEIPDTFIVPDTIPHPYNAQAVSELGFLRTNLLGTVTAGNDDVYLDIKEALLRKRVLPTLLNLIDNFLPEHFFEQFRKTEARNGTFYASEDDARIELTNRILAAAQKMAGAEVDYALGFSLYNSNPADILTQKKALAQNLAAYIESLESMLESKAARPDKHKDFMEARKFAMRCAKFTETEVMSGLKEIVDKMTIKNGKHQQKLTNELNNRSQNLEL